MRAPVKFFDTTPLGRLLNRFSGDIVSHYKSMYYEIIEIRIQVQYIHKNNFHII